MDKISLVGQTTCPITVGFTLPEGYSWDAKVNDEGKKDGVVNVLDEDGLLYRVLHFHNDKLNGICEYYDSGIRIEMRTFVDDVEEGWGCELEERKEVRWFLYSKGVKKAQLVKCDNMDGYWKAIDLCDNTHNTVISICQYDDNHLAVGKGYLYENGHIKKIVLFENGKEKNVLKSFKGEEMTEYDENNNIIYIGGFADDITEDYTREGRGKEYAYERVGKAVVYNGEWHNGKRDGKGYNLKNGKAVYDGEWKEGLPNGKGSIEIDGNLYRGDWIMGKLKLNEFECFDYESGAIENVKKPVDRMITMIMSNNELVELLSNDDLKMKITELVIGEGCSNGLKDDLYLSLFENLDSLFIKKNSLRNLTLLMICDNPVLKRIHFHNSCYRVNSVIIMSMMIGG